MYRSAWYYFVNYVLTGKILETFSKKFLIVIGVIVFGLFLFVYITAHEPDYFEQGVDQLHKSQFIKNKIGGFSSYSYNTDSMPAKPMKNAVFQIELNASDTLYLTCTMKKIGGNWKLVRIHQDSVHKGHE